MTTTALITGGPSGIGRAVANKLGQMGVHVLVDSIAYFIDAVPLSLQKLVRSALQCRRCRSHCRHSGVGTRAHGRLSPRSSAIAFAAM